MTLLTRLANRLTEMDGKSETVKQLAATFNCPYTSLYIPIRELEDAGFLKLKRGTGIVIYGSNPKEPEAVHGNEAEKGVCEHGNWIYGENRRRMCGKANCTYIEEY